MQKANPKKVAYVTQKAAAAAEEILGGKDAIESCLEQVKDAGLNKEWTKRMGELTNRYLALTQVQTKEASNRAAEHPLVDVSELVKRAFPEKMDLKAATAEAPVEAPRQFSKAARASSFRYSEVDSVMEKQASAENVDPFQYECPMRLVKIGADALTAQTMQIPDFSDEQYGEILAKLAEVRYRLASAPHEIRHELNEIRDEVTQAARKAATAATAATAAKQSPTEICERINSQYGSDGFSWMKLADSHLDETMKTAAIEAQKRDRHYYRSVWDDDVSPYKEIREAIVATTASTFKLAALETIMDYCDSVSDELDTFSKVALAAKSGSFDKEAIGPLAGLGQTLRSWGNYYGYDAIRNRGKQIAKMVDNPYASQIKMLNPREQILLGGTPENTEFINKIRAQRALAAVLSDEVISSYPIEKIVPLYNDLVELYPTAAFSPVLLKSIMRQHLENPDITVSELEQIGKVEDIAKRKDIAEGRLVDPQDAQAAGKAIMDSQDRMRAERARNQPQSFKEKRQEDRAAQKEREQEKIKLKADKLRIEESKRRAKKDKQDDELTKRQEKLDAREKALVDRERKLDEAAENEKLKDQQKQNNKPTKLPAKPVGLKGPQRIGMPKPKPVRPRVHPPVTIGMPGVMPGPTVADIINKYVEPVSKGPLFEEKSPSKSKKKIAK